MTPTSFEPAIAPEPAAAMPEAPAARVSVRGHIEIMRIDHWVKNVFVIPGVLVAMLLLGIPFSFELLIRVLIGLFAVGLVASSNYTINEVLDAPFDRMHPTKRLRPVPSGRVNIPLAYVQWAALGIIGIGIGWYLSPKFAAALFALFIMGLVYNVRPVRTKDIPYLDVITEAINNPIRMIAGWYLVEDSRVISSSLLLSYWFVGCFFMAVKRLSEIRQLDAGQRRNYRKSLAYFTEDRMLVAVVFHASAAMLFFGAFIMRYRLELVLSFPFVALVMALYLKLAFRPDSAAQNPEKLYRQKDLMASVVLCTLVMLALLIINMPLLYQLFEPTPIRP